MDKKLSSHSQYEYIGVYLILVMFIVLLFSLYTGMNNFINILQILIWPVVVLTVSILFRKVFTYLFFQIDEFSFFGTKGELRDITEVIIEKAEELKLRDEMKKEFEETKTVAQRQKKDNELLQQQLISLIQNGGDKISDKYPKLIELVRKFSDVVNISSSNNEVLQKEIMEKNKIIEELERRNNVLSRSIKTGVIQNPGISLSQLVELFISLGIITSDKAVMARAAINSDK